MVAIAQEWCLVRLDGASSSKCEVTKSHKPRKNLNFSVVTHLH